MDNSLTKALQITRIIPETKDAKTFVLQPMDNWDPIYKAGQFFTFIFTTATGEKRRSYSISSAPALNELLSITVKKEVNGEFSRQLLNYYKEGNFLYTTGITGFFCLPENLDEVEQLFFIAAGSGITPCFSLIKTLLVTTGKQIVLIYSNRSEDNTIFYIELQSLQKKYSDRFQIHFLFSDQYNIFYGRLSNTLLQALLEKYLKVEKQKVLFYLCGPPLYMQMIIITLLTQGISISHIKKESFDTLPHFYQPVPPDTSAHTVTVHINTQTHQLMVKYPQTILAVAKASSIQLPYSCETGRCGSCAATCISGKIWMAYNEVLMDSEIQKGIVLTCQGFPVEGDAEIQF
jgi:ferredoxin-NADP reductase